MDNPLLKHITLDDGEYIIYNKCGIYCIRFTNIEMVWCCLVITNMSNIYYNFYRFYLGNYFGSENQIRDKLFDTSTESGLYTGWDIAVRDQTMYKIEHNIELSPIFINLIQNIPFPGKNNIPLNMRWEKFEDFGDDSEASEINYKYRLMKHIKEIVEIIVEQNKTYMTNYL